MMFVCRALTHGYSYGVLTVTSQSRAFIAMVGSAGRESQGERALSSLLVDAMGALADREGDDAPVRLADALTVRLAINGEPADRPGWLTYAAALVQAGGISVCHAGDLRVQLVQGDSVVASTTEHTFANMYPAVPDAPRNVIVRSLQRGAAQPDRASWPFAGRGRIVIASSDVHRFAAGESPVAWPGAELRTSQNAGAMMDLEVLDDPG
jgi:hypothetical protein